MSVDLQACCGSWPDAFVAEAEALRQLMGEQLLALHHIGSTAVFGLIAKPVIDMLGVIRSLGEVDAAEPALRALGYVGKGENGIAGRRYFHKNNAAGSRSHHLHLFEPGAAEIERHLAFRDYLRAHPDAAQRYAGLKSAIAIGKRRPEYQALKEPFIAATMIDALDWYRQQRG
ncbi:GrpB family protein [Sandaracinobacter neustonicus]|uniref:GrpB family protein n=1 Tax=Sandaracinobacter neustonicus TaxID=1715348 RepID=A0A501XXC0_9SPHN|nr:GrpB family protein [Sandaracinobacter neustonicus]TPE65220.1 GrpB family protein [Sandaracinobacter neustonicus]